MAYRIEGNELVIDGWEQGITASPYKGIANIQNLNTYYYPGVAYPNYRRQAATLTSASGTFWFAGDHSVNVSGNRGWSFSNSSPMGNPVGKAISPAGLNYILDDAGKVWKQSVVNSSTFTWIGDGTSRFKNGAGGIAYWNNYLVVFGDGVIEFCGDGTGDSTITSDYWNYRNNAGTTSATFSANPPGLYMDATNPLVLNQNDPVVLSTTGTLPTFLNPGATYYVSGVPVISGPNLTFLLSSAPGVAPYTLIDTGNGVHTITTKAHLLPLGNSPFSGGVTFTVNLPINEQTSLTLSSYSAADGTPITTGQWQGPSGNYALINQWNEKIIGTLTNGSNIFNALNRFQFLPALPIYPGTYFLNLLDPTVKDYRPRVSKVDGNLYFCNGRFIGRILAQNTNTSFNPGAPATYIVDYAAFSILQADDTAIEMVDLKNQLIVAGKKDIYLWDYASPSTSAPLPIAEPIKKIINLLNNIYILAGQKGNIYVSNGYSAQLLLKLPDYIAGIVDPVWTWGDIMTHRSRLFFQAMAQTSSGANILSGIFSLLVSPSLFGEIASGLVMEAQNSYGLTPASGATGAGILIDNEPSSNGQDSYYSAWSNGPAAGGIDYNDTSPWQNFESTIETDIIPIGSILDKKTFGQIMFKLDRPMVAGDKIRIYSRPSLTDSYTLLGTTTSTVLSDYYPSNVTQGQWVQFKVQLAGAATGTSFIPLREIRIQIT